MLEESRVSRMNTLMQIFDYAENFFYNKIKSGQTNLEKSAKQSYKAILELTSDILKINNDDSFSRGSKIILKTLIETAVDLENLANEDGYSDIMLLFSLKEEIAFIKYYNDFLKNMTDDDNNYDDNKIKKLNKKMKDLLQEIDGEYNKITKTYFKFNLLALRKRHEKYKLFFDIMAFYAHNNIHAFKKGGIRKIADIKIEEYEDIVASILKNGLLNLARIYEVEEEVDKIRLKELMGKNKSDYSLLTLEDFFEKHNVLDNFEFE